MALIRNSLAHDNDGFIASCDLNLDESFHDFEDRIVGRFAIFRPMGVVKLRHRGAISSSLRVYVRSHDHHATSTVIT